MIATTKENFFTKAQAASAAWYNPSKYLFTSTENARQEVKKNRANLVCSGKGWSLLVRKR